MLFFFFFHRNLIQTSFFFLLYLCLILLFFSFLRFREKRFKNFEVSFEIQKYLLHLLMLHVAPTHGDR